MHDSTPPNNDFPPNFDPTIFSWSAVIIGTILIGDLSVNEQGSLGNWFMLLGQYIVTSSSQQQLIEGRIEKNNININSKKSKQGFGPFTSSSNKSNQNQRDEVDFLLQEVQKIAQELEKLKKNSNI